MLGMLLFDVACCLLLSSQGCMINSFFVSGPHLTSLNLSASYFLIVYHFQHLLAFVAQHDIDVYGLQTLSPQTHQITCVKLHYACIKLTF